MKFAKKSLGQFLGMLVFASFISFGLVACGGEKEESTSEEETQEEEMEAAEDDMSDAAEMDEMKMDSTKMDSTKMEEHPEGGEHPE
jgi:uncharacterized protein involved in copper resistance